jgi:hypothetical protein
MQMRGAPWKGRKVCPKSKSQCKRPRRLPHGKAVRVVEAEVAVKAVRATVVEAEAGVKAGPEVRVAQAVPADGHAESVSISARKRSASFVSRRWT